MITVSGRHRYLNYRPEPVEIGRLAGQLLSCGTQSIQSVEKQSIDPVLLIICEHGKKSSLAY